MIKDNKGKEYNVDIGIYKCTAFVARVMPMDIPVASLLITDEGELRASMRNQDFRDSADMTNAFIEAERYALLNKIIVPPSGKFFCIIHPEHGSNKLMPLMGMKLEVVDMNGSKWNKWSISVDNILSGKVE
jgi:hypothetical protein